MTTIKGRQPERDKYRQHQHNFWVSCRRNATQSRLYLVALILGLATFYVNSIDRRNCFPKPAALFATPDHDFQTTAEDTTMCTFAYSGPLRPSSLNCFLEYFLNTAPITFNASFAPSWRVLPAGERRFATLNGVRWEHGPPPVPIFILFKDRVSVLLETLRSFYRYLRTPYEIIIIHDNSTYPGAVNFISRLKDSGIQVYHNACPWTDFDEFYEKVADIVERHMQYTASPYYVLTDPDCALDSSPWNLLLVYQSILDTLQLDVVGAALRWDDFPENIAEWHYEREVSRLPAKPFTYQGRNYNYIEAQVDTTFAMYRKGVRLKRFAGKQIRMLPPLGARHLDFYLDKHNLPPDYKHYHGIARRQVVNHMGHLD